MVRIVDGFLVALSLLFLPSLPVDADETGGAERLVGLWGNETSFGPRLAGTLTLLYRDGSWHAGIDGVHAAIARKDDGIDIGFAGEHGRFRGQVTGDGARVEGFWIQPPGVTLRNAYATPMTLTRRSPGVWTGNVAPLPDRISLYLQVQPSPDADAPAQAFLRSPEFNFLGDRRYRVEVAGDAVTLVNVQSEDDRLRGVIDAETGQLRIDIQGIGVFALTRRARDDAIGFHPRTPEAQEAGRLPPALDDGWAIASPASVGLDPGRIDALLAEVRQTSDSGGSTPVIHGLLIARRGKLVLEEYFRGFHRERPHDTRSAGKTLAPLLVGAAMRDGAALKPQTRIAPLFATDGPLANDGALKQALTLHDLMSMTSALDCDDNDSDSPGQEDVMQSQRAQPDWYRYTLDLAMTGEPGGGGAVYCSAGMNLVGGVVARATGTWLPEFFRKRIAEPMGMRGYHINLMPQGQAYMAGGIHLRPRDMLKLGQLYLDGGRWEGRRIIDEDWVRASTRRHSAFAPDHGYGYGWHLHRIESGGRTFREYAAEGNGGQFVMVVPELELVVAITAGNYGDFKAWYALRNLVAGHVIPAALAHPPGAAYMTPGGAPLP